MGSYLVRRLLLMALTLFGMSVLIFVMLRLVPGNIADILVDASGADPKEKAKIARELGIDRPIAEQYVTWVNGLAHGDLGFAYVSERPAIEEIAPRIPISAKLAGMALIGMRGAVSSDRQSTRLHSSHTVTSYAVFCFKKNRHLPCRNIRDCTPLRAALY